MYGVALRITPAQLREAWEGIPEVVSAATVTGTSDAILHLMTRDMRHLEAVLERIVCENNQADALWELGQTDEVLRRVQGNTIVAHQLAIRIGENTGEAMIRSNVIPFNFSADSRTSVRPRSVNVSPLLTVVLTMPSMLCTVCPWRMTK